MCLIVLGLAACGKEDPAKADYNGYTYDQLKQELQNTATILTAMTEEEAQQYLASGDEIMVNMITRWQEASKGIGDYKELGEFTITKSGKTLTCAQEVIYEERPVILTYVFTYHNMQLDDVTVDQVQFLGEKMQNAAMNTVLGMGIVFLVLILISLIIYGFKVFPYLEAKRQAKKESAVSSVKKEEKQESISAENLDELELTAVIAAAIAASAGGSAEDFVVRSIKRRF